MTRRSWRELAEEWLGAAFPDPGSNEELRKLHAMLAYADAMVAETILPMTTGGKWSDIPAQARDELRRVEVESRRIAGTTPSRVEADSAKAFTAYAQLLLTLLESAAAAETQG